MFNKRTCRLSKLLMLFALALFITAICAFSVPQNAGAASLKIVPSGSTLVYGEPFYFDVIAENISAPGLGTVQFRLNIQTSGSSVRTVSNLGEARLDEVSIVAPLTNGRFTSALSGFGDFFWNAKGSNGILIIDNEVLQQGSGLFAFSHTSGAVPPVGSGIIARFIGTIGQLVSAESVTVNMSDAVLLNGGDPIEIDALTGATVAIRCRTTVPNLNGLSRSEALSAIATAKLSVGNIYERDNSSGTVPLKVVSEQSLAAGSSQFCSTTINFAINVPPDIQVTNIAEGALLTTAVTPGITITDTDLRSSSVTLDDLPYTIGTPIIKNGAYTLHIVADDMLGNASSLTVHFTIQKNVTPVTLSTPFLNPGTITVPYTASLGISGGTAPYIWSITSGSLPSGLSLNNITGEISGVPAAIGMYALTVQVADLDGFTNNKSFVLSVNDMSARWMRGAGAVAPAVAAGIAIDKAGNSYVTGYSTNGVNNDYLTIKYDQAGTILWSKAYESGIDDHASGIAVDATGNVYVTGYSGTGEANSYLTVKYDPERNVLWAAPYAPGSDNRATGVAVNAAGEVYVAGFTCTEGSCNIAIVTFDSDGAVLRTQNYDSGWDDFASGITIDSAGNVYVTGYSVSETNADLVTLKFDASGALIWAKTFDSGLNDYSSGIAVAGTGNIHVTGYSHNGTNSHTLTIAYDPAGNLVWSTPYQSGFNDTAAGIVVDQQGNSYVAGSSSTSTSVDYQIIKLDPAGNVLWTQRYDNGMNEYASGIAIDAIGSVNVIGYTQNAESQTDYLTIKYQKVGQGIAITTQGIPAAELNTPYRKVLIALGGTLPYTWAVVSGSLPDGMSLNSATGEITGTATVNANVTFTVRVTDFTGAFVEKTFTLIAHEAPVIDTLSLAPGVIGALYNRTISASGGSGTYSFWSITSGVLPPGLILAQNGNAAQITGTPAQVGTYPFTVRVVDSDGLSGVKELSIIVTSLSISTTQLSPGIAGFAYNQTLAATGGTTPYTWSVSSGLLPSGLTLNSETGMISGIPVSSGTYGITIEVSDTNLSTSSKEFSVTINNPVEGYRPGGSFVSTRKILFKPLDGMSIYCTVDGTEPELSPAQLCTGPVVISHSLQLKFFAADALGNRDASKTESYIITGGGAWAWGNNASGAIGDGTSGTNRLNPVPVNGLTGVVAVAGGSAHTVALRKDGTVWTWGNNDSGQLGDGSSGTNRLAPGIVSGITEAIAIDAGSTHTIALKNDGTVWAWGKNDSGQLGDGTSGINRLTPVQVTGISGVADIAAGGSHTFALKNDGTVWAWGKNDSGQLGDGSTGTNRLAPVQATGLTGVIAVAGGSSHSIALKNDGSVWTWGNNEFGQLGDNTSGANKTIPGRVEGLPAITAIAAGSFHATALQADGSVLTWGNNNSGQIGDGTSGTNRLAPVLIGDLTGVSDVGSGAFHTLVRNSDGTARAWGNNDSGQLGDGSSGTNRLSPVSVPGLSSADAISNGDSHGVAITPLPLTVETTSLASGTVNAAYTQNISVYGGLAPYAWSVLTGSLPEGLTLDGVTGVISGTPATAGTFNLTVQVTDHLGANTTQSFSIEIYGSLVITTSSLPAGIINVSYSQTLVASGGKTPYTWSTSSGNLPDGLSLTGSTISGTPTLTGSFTFTVQATDANSATATKELSIVINGSGPLADLSFLSLAVPSTGGAGKSFVVSDNTRNGGAGDAGESTTKFYFSSNVTWEAGDPEIGSRTVPALAVGASSNVNTTVTIPEGVATGTYYIIARADDANVVSETSETNNTLYRPITIGPDLKFLSLAVPSTGGAGKSLVVSDKTWNDGAGDAGESTTKFYFSSNVSWEAGDPEIGSRAVPALAPGVTSSVNTTVTIPEGVATGTYYIIARADDANVVSETSETNNTLYRPITIGPDLKFLSLAVPSTGGAGKSFVVSDNTWNDGAGDAGESTTKFYFSSNVTWEAGDPEIGSRAVPALAPGASSSVNTTVTIPEGVATGTYYIIARADDANVVSETSETNNTLYRPITIGPDLKFLSLAVPSTGGAGKSFVVSDNTWNDGAGDAGESTTKFYFSSNVTWEAGDPEIGSRAVPALAPGASSSVNTTVTIPEGVATGTYYIIARADDANVVSETSENNNTLYRPITIGPDLKFLSLAVPSTGGAGKSFVVSDNTWNDGAGDAGESTTKFYFSSNVTWEAGDPEIGSRAVPALAPGASSSVNTTVTIPEGVATGTYYIIARADDANVVSETSETNNTLYRPITIGPDLKFLSLAVPSTGGAGESFVVSDNTWNDGAGDAGESTTKFYFSSNVTWEAGDPEIGSRTVPALAPGASSNVNTTVTIPEGVATGTYYIIARADDANVVSETNENNNILYRPITIGP